MYFIFIILWANYEKDKHVQLLVLLEVTILIILFQLYGLKADFLKVIHSGWVNMNLQPAYWKKN